MPESLVTLASIANGAALELFEVEFEKVLRNIADVNTSAKAKRTITIKVVVAPDESRDGGNITVQAMASLAHIRQAESKAYFGRKDGKLVAVENNPIQPSMFDEPNDGARVVPLSAVKGGAS